MALDDGASGDHTIPQLNYQTWNDFHSRHDGTPLFSIDILRTSQSEFGIPTEHQPTELPERIRINSPSVVQILNKLRLSKHPKDGPVILFGPYKTLFFFDQEIRQMVAELDRNKCSTPANISVGPDASGSGGENQLAHLRCLIQFMDTHLCARLDFLQGPDCNTILFSDLWLLYKPGDFVVTHDLRQAYQVLRVETKRRIVERNGKIVIEDESAVIHCVYIDFDGQWLGPVHHKVVVEGWALSKLVESLELLPLNRVTLKEKALKQELIRRGQLFVQAAGISAIHYDGRAVDSETQVNGTIIIDFEEALRSEADFKAWRTTIDHSLAGARKPASGFEGDQNEPQPCAAEQGMLYEDSYVDELRYQTYLQSQHTMDKSGYQVPNSAICPRPLHRAEVLTEDELLITNYRAFGYILDNGTLQSNAWGVFDLSLASPISEKASLEFDDFVIPNHVKEMVRNLTTHHLKQMPPSSIISDRCTINKHEGQGLVLLLHGLPGLGKKSTVASIAKMAGVPLLHISTELLWKEIRNGSTENLESSFTFAKRWGCIVMLTQADTILQEDLDYSQAPSISQVDIWNHAPQSVLRRAVVRMMDSFTGITFLIADHGPPLRPVMGSSTKEITSRINANFHYPPLDKAQTTKMFEINMRWINDVFSKQYRDSPRPATLVVDEDILGFATAFYKQRSSFDRWNCTQIRKAFTTALALAQTDAGLSPEGQTGDGPREAWKVTLKAAHFEVVARSLYRSLGGEPPPPPPPPPGGKKKYNDPTYMGHPPPPQQGAPNPYQYQRPRQQLPQQPPPPPPPPPQVSPPIFLPNSRLLPPVEYRAQLPPPPLGQTIGGHPPPPPGLPTVMPGKEFFLASPLSMDARPVLDLLDWEKFKDARSGKGDACAAIEMLKGNPVVSFDMQAQGSVWWSRWGERNREDIPRDKSEAGATAFHKGTDPDGSQSTPLPERIRIHSKYITKILEDIHGSRISKISFVMFRPFRALTYYEQRIRAKYNELATMQGDATSGSDSGAGVRDPGDNTSEMQPDHPRIYEEDGLTWKEEAKPPTDDTSSSYISERSISDVGEVIDTACNAALQHLACLVEFVDMIRARRQYLLSGNCSKVTFADVWHLFKPGDVVLDQEQRQAYRILSFNSSGHRTLPPWKDFDSEQRPIIVLRAVHITFDGEMLGSLRTNFEIVSFEGEVDISSLPVLPLRLARDPDINARKDSSAFRRNLVERGRMFVKMAQSMPMHYNGPLLHPKEEVDSQVVVDFEQAFAFWARAPGFVRPVVEKLIGKTIGYPLVDIPCYASCCAGETVYHDAYAEQKWNEAYIGTLIPDPQDRTQKPSLAIFPRAIRDKNFEEATVSDEDLVIMSYKVCGFVLRNRRWAQMDLKYLSPLNPGARHRHVATTASSGGDMATNPSATEATTLEQLVLPLGHKNIVKSLISQHFQDKATGRYEAEEKDVVRGKGKGLIILLHGAPGVGKTSTAEGVAEAFNKPLFQITSGDLGTNARELEEALEWHFYLANKWDCVLLLDEADVFLSVRSPEDFQRNSLVAVFLRVLEYYAGVLFLTTNRIGDFDEAFSSRIHISLYYPPLNRSSTKKIFDLNLRNIQQRIKERGVDIEVEHDHILSWAVDYWRRNKKMRWNGRQIRNACQTALALAEYDSQHPAGSTPRESADQEEIAPEKNATIKLTIGHLETVAKAYLEFMRYLHEIYGKDAERRAKALGIRAREFSMKNWAAAQGALPQEEEDDNESDEEEATGAEAAQSNKRGLQQEPMDKGKAAPETLIPGLAQQQTTSFAGSPYPYAPFAMPNLPNPYAVPPQFGQTQQPQAAPYQNAADQQRQYFANVAAWNNMLAVGQQVPFPGMAGMPTQAQGGPQGDASFPPRTGV